MTDRPDETYSELGKLLDSMARKRNVRGPYSVARRIRNTTGYQVSGQAISRQFYGEDYPRPSFIAAFAEAFELSIEERDTLAWFYTYRELPDEGQSTL